MDRTQKALLRRELLRDEGVRLEAYRDTLGNWTIGVGHLLGDAPRMTRITQQEADALLDYDIDSAEALAMTLVPNPDARATGSRWRAIVNMTFNLGPRLAQFHKFLAALDHSQWDAAADEMLQSKWATQVGARANRLAFDVSTKGAA